MLLLLPYTEYLGRLSEPRNVADVILVFLLVYAVLKLVRGTRAAPMAAAIGAFALLYWLAVKQDLATLAFILRGALLYIGVAIIVLFQNEIRQALITFGNRFRLPFTQKHLGQFGEGVYDEIILAATTLSSTKTGALIVIERNIGLKNIIDGGVKLDADLSYDLLISIFNTESPLHDGAVVVRRHRVAAASCFLPLTLNPRLSRDLGTRHRAALGVTEDTDAVAVVVSEESGLISIVQRGEIRRGLDAPKLRAAISAALEVSPKREKTKQIEKGEPEVETEEVASV
ncbi:MAG TPA: TIGR00159 family protein [Blastocatellia bacterium]|nr:TIGR00159 family protein [Blastocatellia bacterium]HAF24088.1 TIGR00159 family protein [Blastocatellia bacterium]HCX30538.1 TIGR00159 family protein [Blastocatellia bacterium]